MNTPAYEGDPVAPQTILAGASSLQWQVFGQHDWAHHTIFWEHPSGHSLLSRSDGLPHAATMNCSTSTIMLENHYIQHKVDYKWHVHVDRKDYTFAIILIELKFHVVHNIENHRKLVRAWPSRRRKNTCQCTAMERELLVYLLPLEQALNPQLWQCCSNSTLILRTCQHLLYQSLL